MCRVSPLLTTRARALRRNATPAERLSWRYLCPLRPRFTRQLVIRSYIADFDCRQERLVVELDGVSHEDRAVEDHSRRVVLESAGWRVVRFTNSEVLGNLAGVVQSIALAVQSR
jgi:very-short-patch-repair endonuclease